MIDEARHRIQLRVRRVFLTTGSICVVS
jgi:hypothetical protein